MRRVGADKIRIGDYIGGRLKSGGQMSPDMVKRADR